MVEEVSVPQRAGEKRFGFLSLQSPEALVPAWLAPSLAHPTPARLDLQTGLGGVALALLLIRLIGPFTSSLRWFR